MANVSRAVAAATVALAAGSLPMAVPAGAATTTVTVASGFVTPLQIAIRPGGPLVVAESFAGKLTAVRGSHRTTLAAEPTGTSLGGVDAPRPGAIVYTTTTSTGEGPEGQTTAATLKRVLPFGRGTAVIADLLGYEKSANLDKVNSYGFQNLPSTCASQITGDVPAAPYAGQIDSNPYAVKSVAGGWIVADAGGNDLLYVSGSTGHVRTLAVLPPVTVTVTQQIATEIGLPTCALGAQFNFEPVPTDVEVGPQGQLYVSGLSGGDAPGAVYRVDMRTGAVTRIGFGFAGATNLAIAPNGTVYVTETFGGQISKLVNGAPSKVLSASTPAGLEWAYGRLYASVSVFSDLNTFAPNPASKVITFRP